MAQFRWFRDHLHHCDDETCQTIKPSDQFSIECFTYL